MTREIEVTQHLIDTGSRQSCVYCPVALAIIGNLKLDNLKILISPSYVGFYPKNSVNPNERYGKVHLPLDVYEWIVNFDHAHRYTACKPITFSLIIPERLWNVLERANRINTN